MELQLIQQKIHDIRGYKVMLDFDLAEMYDVETRATNQGVKRNLERFPEDFMFQLTKEEWKNLKSQIVISSWGGARSLPFAFTEHGVAMLSSVLRSEKAIKMNIAIIRAFVTFRRYALTYNELAQRLDNMEFRFEDFEKALTLLLKERKEQKALQEKEQRAQKTLKERRKEWDKRQRIGFKK